MIAAIFAAFFLVAAQFAGACETVLTHAEISADRSRAVEFFGPAVNTQLGEAVNSVGDVNGDGFDDFALAAPYVSATVGAVFLVFGRSAAAWASAQFEFNATDTPDAASWIRISGVVDGSYLGNYGIAFGDFNGDRLSDFLISTSTGAATCVYGHTGAWRSFNVSEVESGAVPGFAIIQGPSAKCVGNAGDANGDGIEDLQVVIGDSAFVVFGVSGASRENFYLDLVDGSNGFVLTDGTPNIGLGRSAGSLGDVNGDGLADFAIGSVNHNLNAGRAFILFSRNVSASGVQWPALFNLTSRIDGTNGFIVDGTLSSAQLGYFVVGAGDVNGDGFADVFIGSGSSWSGAWVVFGHQAPWPSPILSSSLDGANGFHFAPNSGYWGNSGGGTGDVNGDRFDDIIIGGYQAYSSTSSFSGAAVILFGRAGSWPASLNLNDAVGSVGFKVDGPSSDSYFGYSVCCAGDVNGDGLSDFVVGAHYDNTNTGYATLVFGTPDDHCAVCSNTTDACLVCEDGFSLNGTICINASTAISSSSSAQQGVSVVVIIRFLEDVTDPTELQEEIASVLGIDAGLVSVVVVSPTEVEVTIIGSEETAQHLVDIINNGGSGSGDGSGLGLLRKAIDAHIRKDTDDNGSSDDGVDAAPRIALFHPTALVLLTFVINAAAATL